MLKLGFAVYFVLHSLHTPRPQPETSCQNCVAFGEFPTPETVEEY